MQNKLEQPDPKRKIEVTVKPIDQEAVKFAKESWHQEKFKLNGKDVVVYGLAHIPETFSLYRNEIEDAISKASIVVLEGVKTASGLNDPRLFSEYTYPAFPGQMEWLAATHNKLVVTADPRNFSLNKDTLALLSELDKENTDIEKIKKIISSSGPPISLAATAVAIIDYKKGIIKRPMTRRAFLGVAAASAGASLTASLSELATLKDISPDRGRQDNPLGAFLYELMDYRNVVVAEGLNRLSKNKIVTNNGPIVVFYGDAHRTALKHYAESPTERSLKLKSYLSFNDISKPKLRIFKADRIIDEQGRWDSANEFKWQTVYEENI